MAHRYLGRTNLLALGLALLMMGCVDFRSDVTSGPSSSTDVDQLQPWPDPDASGLIVIDGRRYVEALPGETLTDIARRFNLDPDTLSDINNGMHVNRRLPKGRIIRLPAIHPDPTQPVQGTNPVTGTPVTEGQYILHTVQPAETLYTIAEIYDISVRTLAEWNGLQSNLEVKADMVLIIPVRQPQERSASPAPAVVAEEPLADTDHLTATSPGREDPTPAPPAAATADGPPVTTAEPQTPPAELEASEVADSMFALPMEGTLKQEFATVSGHDGLDITAPVGTGVFAVDDGVVALVSGLTEKSAIVLIRHANDVYSVYQHITGVALQNGDRVTKGQKFAELAETPGYLHFEIREGTVGVDPRKFLPEGSYPA